jgi:NAD(P) transhydrogenase subunit alpha
LLLRDGGVHEGAEISALPAMDEADEVADEGRIRPLAALVGGDARQLEQLVDLLLRQLETGRVLAALGGEAVACARKPLVHTQPQDSQPTALLELVPQWELCRRNRAMRREAAATGRARIFSIRTRPASWPRIRLSRPGDEPHSETSSYTPLGMKVGVPKETAPGERRVALVADGVKRLSEIGIGVVVEAGAGAEAGVDDERYAEAGAQIASETYAEVDVVCKVQKPSADELARLRGAQTLIGLLQPLTSADLVQALADKGVTAFSLDSIPRITRAQPMDALSSQSTVAGYKAVLLAASHLGKFFPMLTTAAGTIAPARVLVLGAGVAGLQAIATARRLGAVVSAFDVRPVVKEQVESLGATFLELDVEGAEGVGGYAVALAEDQHAREQELISRHVAESDAVITTALVPGRPAPKLITAEAARAMRPGSVVVDVAAEAGGNCELTVPGQTVVEGGVTLVGEANLAATVPVHASQMYSRNVYTLLAHLVSDGELVLDFDDEITRETCITHEGRVLKEPVAV